MSDVVVVVLVLAAMAAARWLRPTSVRRHAAPAAPVVLDGSRSSFRRATRRDPPRRPAGVARRARPPVRGGRRRRRRLGRRDAEVARAAGAQGPGGSTAARGVDRQGVGLPRGAGVAGGDLLLFLDADTVLAPTPSPGSSRCTRARRAGVGPALPPRRPSARAALGLVQPGRRDGERGLRRHADAVGALGSRWPSVRCLLTSRADLDRAGGHAAVRAEILDDAALAAAYDRAGLPVVCLVGGRRCGCAATRRDWASCCGGLDEEHRLRGLDRLAPGRRSAPCCSSAAHHAVAVGATLTVLDATTGIGGTLVGGHAAVWVAAYVALALQLRTVLRRLGSFRWWTWALVPVSLVAFDLVFARSAVLSGVRRSVQWRGRDVDLRGRDSADEVA